MNCDQFTDLIELYAIGSLEKSSADALRVHLEDGCEKCASLVDEALAEAELISSAIPLVEPPPGLRERIAASVRPPATVVPMPVKKARPSFAPWLVAAASVIGLAAGLTYEENARRTERAELTAALDTSRAETQRTVQMLNILQAPGTKEVELKITKPDEPTGNVFIHKQLGVAMVIAHLPTAPAGWTYESWIVPKSGAPQPVEAFANNRDGVAVTVVKGPVDVSQWAALAVSLEPANTAPVKPTKVIFLSPV